MMDEASIYPDLVSLQNKLRDIFGSQALEGTWQLKKEGSIIGQV